MKQKPYGSFLYRYPPRPETKTTPEGIASFERMGYWAQPKLNGSCSEIYTDGTQVIFMGRHKDTFSRNLIPQADLRSVHRGKGWTVLVGEYMNKSKKGADGKKFDGCFVIFDILVHNGVYLLGTTFRERQELLEELYPMTMVDDFIGKVSENIYRVKCFRSGLSELWKKIVKIDMYEGWVLKRHDGKLEEGVRPNNNMGWQAKVRKATLNYKY